MEEMYLELSSSLETLKPNDPNTTEILEKLKETHATSAGLKAFCTWACLRTIDDCRQACGGHGYSACALISLAHCRLLIRLTTKADFGFLDDLVDSAFPSMYNDFAVQCTWEGDNTILALQSGRSLLASYNGAFLCSRPPCPARAVADFLTPPFPF
jgi:acyl-CoA oxidase